MSESLAVGTKKEGNGQELLPRALFGDDDVGRAIGQPKESHLSCRGSRRPSKLLSSVVVLEDRDPGVPLLPVFVQCQLVLTERIKALEEEVVLDVVIRSRFVEAMAKGLQFLQKAHQIMPLAHRVPSGKGLEFGP